MAGPSKFEYYWSFSEDFPFADMWFLKAPFPAKNALIGGLLQRVQVGGFGSLDHFPRPQFYTPGPVILDAIKAQKGPGQLLTETISPIIPTIKTSNSSDFSASITGATIPGISGLTIGGGFDFSNVVSISLSIADASLTYIFPSLLKDLASANPNLSSIPGLGNVSEGDVYVCHSQLLATKYQLTVEVKPGTNLNLSVTYGGAGLTVKYTNNQDNTFTLDVSVDPGNPPIILAIGTSRYKDLA